MKPSSTTAIAIVANALLPTVAATLAYRDVNDSPAETTVHLVMLPTGRIQLRRRSSKINFVAVDQSPFATAAAALTYAANRLNADGHLS